MIANFIKRIFAVFIILCFSHSIMAQGGEREFPFPHIPDLIIKPQQRASWLICHYWDNIDFSDDNIISDTVFIEQAFVNFLSIFPIIESDEDIALGVKLLLQKAEIKYRVYEIVISLAEKYLFELDSPLMNEEFYIFFLEQINNSNFLSDVKKSRTKYHYNIVVKNRKGTKAANFDFVTSNGENSSLYDILTDELIIFFYDPECDNCIEVINKLKNNIEINKRIILGKTKILAIYPDGDYYIWQKSISKMPENWIVAFATSPIQPIGKYILRALPTIYVVDKNKKVLVKDINVDNL